MSAVCLPTELLTTLTLSKVNVVIDFSVLAEHFAHSPQKILIYADKFLKSAQQGLSDIEECLERNDLEQMVAFGHRLKSSAKTVGANGFADLCHALERHKGSGNLDAAAVIIDQLPAILVRIGQQVAAYRQRGLDR